MRRTNDDVIRTVTYLSNLITSPRSKSSNPSDATEKLTTVVCTCTLTSYWGLHNFVCSKRRNLGCTSISSSLNKMYLLLPLCIIERLIIDITSGSIISRTFSSKNVLPSFNASIILRNKSESPILPVRKLLLNLLFNHGSADRCGSIIKTCFMDLTTIDAFSAEEISEGNPWVCKCVRVCKVSTYFTRSYWSRCQLDSESAI